nr:hypothetical protein [Mucilaginibacter sp. X4EP1]
MRLYSLKSHFYFIDDVRHSTVIHEHHSAT